MNNKSPFEDIIPPKKRSIRNIPLSSSHPKELGRSIDQETPAFSHSTPPRYEREISLSSIEKKRSPLSFTIAGISVGLLLIILFFISSFFHSATVEVSPKRAEADVDASYQAFKQATGTDLAFETVVLSEEVSTKVPATSEKTVSEKATGKIVIYNKNSVAQRLISNTRFEAASGKIYRLTKEVTVPAQKTISGKVTPGSIEASVIADAPGPSYNAPLTDFTLPAFKGTAKYTTVYARSKTDMTGGAAGVVKIAAQEDIAKAETELKNKLKDILLRGVQAQKPDTYVFPDSFYTIRYTSLPQVSEDTSVVVTQKAEITAVIFNDNDLAARVARETIPGYNKESVRIENIDAISLSLATSTLALGVPETITFGVKGSVKFIYVYNRDDVVAALKGSKRTDFMSIITRFPGIEKAHVVIHPFWKGVFPDKVEEIRLIET